MCNHENNVASHLSPQWLYGDSCTWADDVYHLPKCMSCHELPQSHFGDNRETHRPFSREFILN